MKRRDFLVLGGYAAVAAGLQGCFPPKPSPVSNPDLDTPKPELLIDAHVHLFNGADLQVEGFIKTLEKTDSPFLKPMVNTVAAVMQKISWKTAPDYHREKQKLDDLKHQKSSAREALYEDIAREQYKEAARALGNALDQLRVEKDLYDSDLLDRIEKDLGTFRDNEDKSMDQPKLSLGKLHAVTRFILEFFQYRFLSAHHYLRTYDSPDHAFDLMVNHIVDYEWWLNAQGNPAPTTLEQQMLLAKKLSIHTEGRIHAFVPFDPLRQLLYDDGVRKTGNGSPNFNPMELVEKSIFDWGAVGVKLYPPMGFSMGENHDFKDLWKKNRSGFAPPVQELMAQEDFGKQLDDCLKRLYAYCHKKDIPLMMHSNRSNFSRQDFDLLIDPPLWNCALRNNKVTSCYAHLGGAGNRKIDALTDAEHFVYAMQLPGSRQFADTSYFSDMAGDSEQVNRMAEKLDKLFAQKPVAHSRFHNLMYGTDWKMLLFEKSSKTYLKAFYDIVYNLKQRHGDWDMDNEIPKIMGINAVRYLQLFPNGENRKRLRDFYIKNHVPEPGWYTKTRGMPA